MKKNFVLFTVIILPLVIYSQNKILPGYYVDLKGDTTYCKIKFRDWAVNPESISIESGNDKKTLGLNDIKAFGVENYGHYEKARINLHTNPIGGLSLPEEYSDETIIKEVFLKTITNGTYTLFELQLPTRAYYFFREKDQEIQELVYRVKQKELQITENEEYKRTLNGLFESNNLPIENRKKISSLRYDKESLKKIFLLLNKGETNITTFEKKITKRPISIDVFTGGILHQFPSKFDGKNIQNNKLDPILSPTAGVSLLYLIPAKFNRIGISLSFGFSGFKSTFSSYDSTYTSVSSNFHFTTINNEEYSIKNSMLRANFSCLYSIYPLAKTKFYLKLGALYNLSFSNTRNINVKYSSSSTGIRNGNIPFSNSTNGEESLIPIAASWVNISSAMGIISGKSKFEVGYFLPTDIYSSASKLNKFSIGALSVCYYYSFFH